MPDEPRTRSAQASANVALATEFWDCAINRGDAAKARALLSAAFTHHEPDIEPGPDGFAAHLATLAPALSIDPVRHIADGDFVVSHHRRRSVEAETATIDILRIEEGKVVEWWHVFQPVPAAMANANGMF